MTITENINRIKQAKEDIKEAIIAKGVEVSDDVRIDGYAEKIGEIKQGGGGQFAIDYGEEIYTNNAYSMTAEQEDIDYYNQIQAERAAYAAGTGGRSDAEIQADLEFKEKIAWWPKGMALLTSFAYVYLLRELELSTFGGVFTYCTSLRRVIIEEYTKKTVNNLFFMCSNLRYVSIDLTKITSITKPVQYSPALKDIYLSGLGCSLNINAQEITKESLIYMYDNCRDVEDTYTLTLKKTVKTLHSQWLDEDANYAASFAAANAKGLTIA